MPAYLYQAPAGVPGDITRVDETNVEPAMLDAVASVYAQKYGIPMVYGSDGNIQQYASGNTAAQFAGILARSAPEISGNLNAGFDDTVPNPVQPQNLVVRGYVSVKCAVGTPVRGGVVWIRVVASSGHVIGDLETADAGAGATVALSLTQASWACNGKDADNNAEIRVAR